MSREFNLKDVLAGIVDVSLIDQSRKTIFLVTFETSAYEEGHVRWLNCQFESWKKQLSKEPGVIVHDVKVVKAAGKGKKGTIEVGIEVPGMILMSHAENTIFAGNLMSAIRKTLAEIVLQDYSPKFDFRNPLFSYSYVHKYSSSLASSDWKKGRAELAALAENHFELQILIEDNGAMLRGIEVDVEKGTVSIDLRWRLNANENQRMVLEKVLKAYFRGMGFDAQWKIEPVQ